VLVTIASFTVQRRLAQSFSEKPWGCVFPAAAVAGLIGIRWAGKSQAKPFQFSSMYVLGMLTSTAFGFPACCWRPLMRSIRIGDLPEKFVLTIPARILKIFSTR